METLNEILRLIIYAIVTSTGITIVYKLLNLINSYIDKVQTTTKLSEYEKLNKLIDGVQNIISDVVESTSQVYVDTLKKEGNFNKDSQKIAKNMALEKAKELINDESIKAIESLHGDLDTYLDVLIEKTVSELKK